MAGPLNETRDFLITLTVSLTCVAALSRTVTLLPDALICMLQAHTFIHLNDISHDSRPNGKLLPHKTTHLCAHLTFAKEDNPHKSDT